MIARSIILLGLAFAAIGGAHADDRPNVVLMFLDDAAYADFHPFGNPPYPTPNVERLAKEGVRYTRFQVPQAVCSASRAALLTGRYPHRNSVVNAIAPGRRGLDPKHPIIAETLKEHGYATAHFGKWHLGDVPETRPMARGFDEYAGLLVSNDMWQRNPAWRQRHGNRPLPYWENGVIRIEDIGPNDQKHLTAWATEGATRFIRSQAGKRPFFLYVAHSMPHVPLYCRDEFKGKSGAGLYGDVIMEIDWSVGRIMETLREAGVEKNTIILLTSDNGPWEEFGNHAGKTPFREHKGTSFEGGVRSALTVKFPRELQPGTVNDRAFASIDLYPTLAALAGVKLKEEETDGKNIWPLMRGDEGAANPHQYYFFSVGWKLEAAMTSDGIWKLHLPHGYRDVVRPGRDGSRGETRTSMIEESLFNLIYDPLEQHNLLDKHPDVASDIRNAAANYLKQVSSERGPNDHD
ncbi:MAG: sulfatase [Akkermansiaceae bacterium]|jgi:arylsulfatase A-like enzyme|nr:sulfatase [Akkermansiaceae bacterium]